ncbi:hypothetical protein INT43_003975 [Umbelopsis isabellina]|uniref:NAD-dependent epimerase/dehydratase domain-containing protein n=1 Tax=Mortierella isabellina TaxID=91625 RepID=A0A8H7UC56_MORIS|nr:hypothetical protein INT43_003975 [Umbelopsis isabellina]
MSTLTAGSKILVTGATGFIGAQVCNEFLKAGHTVVGTTRKAARAQKLREYFERYGAGKFEVAEIEDLEQEGAFDELVKDVEAIAHVASPVFVESDDPVKDYLNKAVNGTLSILNSALRYGKSVKHVVVTSSSASVVRGNSAPEYAHTEEDWNTDASEMMKQLLEKKQPVPHMVGYAASKVEAERALWKFREEAKPHFYISTVLPTFVIGEILPPPGKGKPEEIISSSSKLVLDYYTGENQDPAFTFGSGNRVAVVDVALAHVRAAQRGQATDGQRYILNNRYLSFQEVVDILRKHYPDRNNIIVEGNPGQYGVCPKSLDGSKATRELGIQYTDLETAVVETVESVKQAY